MRLPGRGGMAFTQCPVEGMPSVLTSAGGSAATVRRMLASQA
ncbi:hypothetical protein [Polyangium mundeleinium]|uniref:Uncharacterized protein n=1 Tax=Polyangium mundeleinium TaxID=2995306 RepID=A0ABT5EQC0_9BACT|nr:hypothetical protein [Polyangium mundeleinium]MDC0743534.1 hypothetical protein [Polyangium mundeleinium]